MHQRRPIQILPAYEIKQFDQPPQFTTQERRHFFSLCPVMHEKVKKIRGDINPIGLMLQYGYFKATGKLFQTEQFRLGDVQYIAKQLKITQTEPFKAAYVERSRLNHQKLILEVLGYKTYKSQKVLFRQLINELVTKHISPRKIIFSVVDLLHAKKIEVPNYVSFANEITDQYQTFEDNLTQQVKRVITEEHKEALDQLTDKDPIYYRRPLLSNLKTISQAIDPGKISESMRKFLIIKKLRDELLGFIEHLDISSEAVRYYAQWVIKAKVTQITEITDENKRYLYLICFVIHQFKMRQDTFIDTILKVIQHFINKAEQMVNALNGENLTEKNKLTVSVIEAFHKNQVSVQAVRSILYNKAYTDTQKISSLYKVVPEEGTDIETQAEEAAYNLFEKIQDESANQQYYCVLESLSRKLQSRVADCFKYLGFMMHHSLTSLDAALQHYQASTTLTKTVPGDFLDKTEKQLVFKDKEFNISLYKAIFFIRMADGIKSGAISLSESYRYMPIESYMLDKERWYKDRHAILEKCGLLAFEDINALLPELKKELDKRYKEVNQRIESGDNVHVKIKKEGGFSLHTPAIDKPDYDSVLDLLGRDQYISILQMMAVTNIDTQFTGSFKHYKRKGGQSPPSDETFFAGLFALGTNIGLHKLANSARGINYNTLTNAVEWRFSLENLYAVNDILVERMNKMWLPNQFKKEKEFLHTSSDAQKRTVTAESLNANCSYKYFGNGKGANIYMFIDERGILFYSTVFSSSERDAAYVLDGLLHNEDLKSTMHSTDTHGYSEMVFAASHLIGVSFAPRIKDISAIALVSFDKIAEDQSEKNCPIKPSQYADTTTIKANWDDILRLIATIKLREHKASIVLKRLSSYAKQHPILAGLKAFGRIIKSLFILNYIDDVELRQTIEKQLNKGELANKFSSAITFINNQEIIQGLQEDQDVAAMCKLILQNIIILWNYTALTKLIMRSDEERQQEILDNLKQSSILAWGHANLLGLYDFRNLSSQNDDDFTSKEVVEFKLA